MEKERSLRKMIKGLIEIDGYKSYSELSGIEKDDLVLLASNDDPHAMLDNNVITAMRNYIKSCGTDEALILGEAIRTALYEEHHDYLSELFDDEMADRHVETMKHNGLSCEPDPITGDPIWRK